MLCFYIYIVIYMTTEVVLLIKTNYYYDVLEWIEYYKKLGFDHITIYDNDSNIDFLNIINKYKNFITYIKISGFPDQLNLELKYYNNSKYDYVFFADADEFLWLSPKYKNINDYIDQKTKELNCNHIAIYWVKISANPCPEFREDSLETTQIKTFKYIQDLEIDSWCKCIYKTGLAITKMACHFCYPINEIKDVNGNSFKIQNTRIKNYNYKNDDALIYHFYHKSYNEYVQKIDGTYAPEQVIVKNKFPNRIMKTYFNYLKLLYNIGYYNYDNKLENFLYTK